MKRETSANPLSFLAPIYMAGVICAALLQVALFVRPGPYGEPYVLNSSHYLRSALIYECYGVGLTLAPFALVALCVRDTLVRRILFVSAACVVGALLTIGHINHELQRFMGIRLSSGFFATYAKLESPPEAIIQSLADDAGGAWLSVLLLAVPLMLFPWLVWRFSRVSLRLTARVRHTLLAGGVILLFILPALAWNVFPNGANRMEKVA